MMREIPSADVKCLINRSLYFNGMFNWVRNSRVKMKPFSKRSGCRAVMRTFRVNLGWIK